MNANQIKNVLITGAAGSGGSYILEHFTTRYPNWELKGLIRSLNSNNSENLNAVRSKINFVIADLTNPIDLESQIDFKSIDLIVHLASNADVLYSFANPADVLNNNIRGTINLLEACRTHKFSGRLLMCSTSEVYGQVLPNEVPIKETNAIRPASPYAVSKVTQDLLSQVYSASYGLDVVRSRMFTYINPRRENLFATAFAMQVARIEAGRQKVLKHGNLNSVRTHLNIRDVCRAYEEIALKGIKGEVYNFGGKNSFTVGEFLELLKAKANCAIETKLDSSLLRPNDVTLQIPDCSSFEAITNWRPEIGLSESVDELLLYCRLKVKNEILAEQN
jgi:GDP-4-dehydro-6-deoxy-D-mannose reductase